MPRKPKLSPRKDPALVICHWTDAAGSDDNDVQPIDALTAGWLVELTDKYVKIAGEVFRDGDTRQHTAIPLGMVKEIIKVKRIRVRGFDGWSAK